MAPLALALPPFGMGGGLFRGASVPLSPEESKRMVGAAMVHLPRSAFCDDGPTLLPFWSLLSTGKARAGLLLFRADGHHLDRPQGDTHKLLKMTGSKELELRAKEQAWKGRPHGSAPPSLPNQLTLGQIRRVRKMSRKERVWEQGL